MNKKYLIERDACDDVYDEFMFEPEHYKEVEVLDDKEVNDILPDFHLHNELETLSDYLKANKYLIVKIIE